MPEPGHIENIDDYKYRIIKSGDRPNERRTISCILLPAAVLEDPLWSSQLFLSFGKWILWQGPYIDLQGMQLPKTAYQNV